MSIGGTLFSPDDIEHGVLRANTRHPYATPPGQQTFWPRNAGWVMEEETEGDKEGEKEWRENEGTEGKEREKGQERGGREALSLPALDPRIHFVLNCGAASCPPIKVLGTDPEPGKCICISVYKSECMCVYVCVYLCVNFLWLRYCAYLLLLTITINKLAN